MGLLLDQSDLIPITVYYSEKVNKHGARIFRVINEDKAKAALADPLKAPDIKVLKTKFRQQSWEIQQQLYRDAAKYNPVSGLNDTDWPTFSDLQLKKLLAEWDLVNEETQQPYPVLPEYVGALPSPIANELLAQFRLSTMLEDDEGSF